MAHLVCGQVCVLCMGMCVCLSVCVCVCVFNKKALGHWPAPCLHKDVSGIVWHSQHTREKPFPSSWVLKTSCFCTALVGTTTGALTDRGGGRLWDSHCLCYFPGLSTNTIITFWEFHSGLMFLVTPDIESPPLGTAPFQMQAKKGHPKQQLRHLQVFWPCPNSAPAVSLDLHIPSTKFPQPPLTLPVPLSPLLFLLLVLLLLLSSWLWGIAVRIGFGSQKPAVPWKMVHLWAKWPSSDGCSTWSEHRPCGLSHSQS